ncbi:hypothetical protein C3432_25940 [Citrobacter amalonaticus]|uniref:Uncharacterized protein n=1 Tax=Citrobacter amalonaticus TaxID=35703 RepID=A0A2S4RRC2_CITAM|nr:hypothetical protein [Citrobacter amalonaticus]POT54732.1 hypothetical protein C3432_25940 [Citrobacter amalonaticus]POT69940.1 hypothetical protein C3436_25735 [Citrobacter amalonaticus]POU61199.1 hypothetical protein C3430_24650 [Citrobacter amalonaticus]POV02553.1 hypothetical protein C3424_25980 [Citrobacter amalonaticus]
MQTLELEASLSDGAKKKIQEGSWRFIGATVQDTTTGKIVANLKTVEKKADTGYTPALFVALENEICISQQLISAQIRDEFRSLKGSIAEGIRQIVDKVDFQTEITLGQLIGEINHFFLQCDHLKSGELKRAETILHTGGVLAARLAGMTDVLIRDYLGNVRVTMSSGTISYKQYQALGPDSHERRWGKVTVLTYPDLLTTQVKRFIPALTEIINRLNIISVCFYHELYMGYQDSLSALRAHLKQLLDQLVNGVPVDNREFDDYAQRVFGKDDQRRWIHDNEADRLAEHYETFSRNNLGARNFRQISYRPSDRDLVRSVREVLNMIDSIDNLLLRAEDLENGSLLDTESVALLRENTFPLRQNRPLLPDDK